MVKQKFDIFGMTCSACAGHVHKSVSRLTGVLEVNVNLLKNSMSVVFDPKKVNAEAVIDAVQKAGYRAALQGAAAAGPDQSGAV